MSTKPIGSLEEHFSQVNEITQGQVLGVDGKQLRRSHDRSKGKKSDLYSKCLGWTEPFGLEISAHANPHST